MSRSEGPASDLTPLLTAMLNMTAFHREHEKFYSTAPREQAVVLQRHSRTLHALADQWTTTAPSTAAAFSPYEGAPDLNAAAALQLDGVLFMEGRGRTWRDPPPQARSAHLRGRRCRRRRVARHRDAVVMGCRRRAPRHRRARRHARRTAPHHRQQLARRIDDEPRRRGSSSAQPTCSTASTSPPLPYAPTSPTGTPRRAGSTPPRR